MRQRLTLRIGEDVFAQLEAQSRRTRQSRSAVAKKLLKEGLRMEQHHRIVFRTGPGGRRAGLIDGPDVWDVVTAVRRIEDGDSECLADISERTGLTTDQVRTAFR